MTRELLESLGLMYPIGKADLKVRPCDPPYDHAYPRPSRGIKIHPFSGTMWWQECGRKRAHMTMHDALAVIAQLPPVEGWKKAIYICRWCDWFHIGNKWDGGPVGK